MTGRTGLAATGRHFRYPMSQEYSTRPAIVPRAARKSGRGRMPCSRTRELTPTERHTRPQNQDDSGDSSIKDLLGAAGRSLPTVGSRANQLSTRSRVYNNINPDRSRLLCMLLVIAEVGFRRCSS
jgi:hypothetical protein